MKQVSKYDEQPVSVRTKIAGLWAAMLFVFAYVDIFSLMRADVIEDVMNKTMAGNAVDQTFLTLTTVFIVIPSLMLFLTLVLKASVSRMANMIVAGLYILAIIGSAIGEGWHYYLLGSAIEVALLVVLIRYCVTWPKVRT